MKIFKNCNAICDMGINKIKYPPISLLPKVKLLVPKKNFISSVTCQLTGYVHLQIQETSSIYILNNLYDNDSWVKQNIPQEEFINGDPLEVKINQLELH